MANTALLDRIKKNSTLGGLKTLDKSPYLQNQDNILTEMPVLNIAFSGELDKGFRSGLIQFAGPSKHFKTNLALVAVKAFFDKYPDAICLFFDSEFGITNDYLAAQGIDPTQVIHIPVMNIEELRFEIVNQLEGLTRDDKVIILIDSIGNLASKKEVEDSKNENGAQDMSRPKMLKSLGRIVTPYLTTKDIPCIAINHVLPGSFAITTPLQNLQRIYVGNHAVFRHPPFRTPSAAGRAHSQRGIQCATVNTGLTARDNGYCHHPNSLTVLRTFAFPVPQKPNTHSD